MTPRSFSRAVERKAKHAMQPATAPMPIPYEPGLVPVLPSPEVELPAVLSPEPASAPSDVRVNVSGERLEEFFELAASLIDHYHPATMHEHSLVENLARERWFLLRRERVFNAIEADLYKRQPEPSKWSETEFKRLALAGRYRSEAERTFHRSLKSVKAFCKERVTNYRWGAMYDMAVRQLEFEKKKHELNTIRGQEQASSG